MKSCSMAARFLFVGLIIIHAFESISQITIKGPKCVLQGIAYQYDVKMSKPTAVDVCITGGRFLNSSSACSSFPSVSDIRIVWDSTSVNGMITIKTSTEILTKYEVQISGRLQGGKINTASVLQTIKAKSKPAEIICNDAKYGNCITSYSYQWQISEDYLKWSPINGANNKDLKYSSALTRSVYFRRMVTEINSGNTEFSDTATVIVVLK